ncbi:MAG: AAA family ATPase, partial [Candidatus Aminicenantes bacterium]|nr:AAA family ATPase [Candidatus Aminicenantes bacterium]
RKLTSKNNDFSIFSDNVFWRFIISLRDLLHGFFHLGAIRDNFDKDEDNNIDRDEYDPIEKQRYVGPKGEYTHFLINRFCWNLMTSKKDLCLGEYYSIWLKNLLGLGSCYTADSTGEGGDTVKDRTKKSTTPADFLKLYIPDKNATPDRHPIGEDPTDYPTDYSRYGSDVLWGDGLAFGPSCFSSGFHQIAPMIVQSGLMKKYEVCAIENPEVHLHPDLQMKLTEFLLDQAVSKRFFIIETHSDLIIRRLIRAILEEDKPFAQEKICINFTRIEPHSGWRRNLQSKIEPLQVDGQGRIKNWPARFMSESIKESQRLMDIMYRQDTQNEDDDE